MFTHIEKDQINQLPPLNFTAKIHLITTMAQLSQIIKNLEQQKYLGFDTESRPAFKKGEHYPISLLQLATMDDVYLFRINLIKIPPELKNILTNPRIIKTGVAIRDDIIGLQKIGAFEPAGFIELADLARTHGIIHQGLRGISAVVMGEAMSKAAKLTNWEATKLNHEQIRYAAIDAWASLKNYLILKKL